ncbi:hypothetical protein cyc_03454 [Cyclospora cayetanensis]|uniref:Uncharacterized protein n=1 Tax=Cyclospora cayetanensis TaxID=88456 RepID=A0A1D3D2W6_9EIME|nr:hypothetical protein cyc_03454 [Cyclospora cayetanensis]
MQGLKKLAKEKAAALVQVASGHEKKQQDYSIGYEAYRHFAFFAGLLLQANAPTPTKAADLVKWYAIEPRSEHVMPSTEWRAAGLIPFFNLRLCLQSAYCLLYRYLTEKAYCVPRDLPRPLVPRVYTTLVNNLILDSCVEVNGEGRANRDANSGSCSVQMLICAKCSALLAEPASLDAVSLSSRKRLTAALYAFPLTQQPSELPGMANTEQVEFEV